MEFSNTTNDSGIVQEVHDLCTSTDESYPINAITRRANLAMSKVADIIFKADGRFEWDDNNYTTSTVYDTDIVAGQGLYDLDNNFVTIENVEYLLADGTYKELTAIDKESVTGSISDFMKEDGEPVYFDVKNDTVQLYPAPATDTTNGLRLHVSRVPTDFVSTDTTKTAGFNKLYHEVIPYEISIPYCVKFRPERVQAYMIERDTLLKNISDFYRRRSVTVNGNNRMIPRVESTK